MSNKKGFTLAELLGVLAILAIVSLITVPLVNKYITNSRQKAYDTEINTLKEAAKQWFVKNSASIEWDDDDYYALNLEDLKKSEFLADDTIYNPLKPDEEITGCIMIKNDAGNYSYTYSKNCSKTFLVYANGTAVYFNPVTGTKCTAGESVSTTGTKTGCMKWYAFNDNSISNKVNLILDHNTTAAVQWNSINTNVNGPTNVLVQLASDTSSWVGVPTRTDNYSVSNGTATYTINYSTYKARLITTAEIATIVGNSIFLETTSGPWNWFYLDNNNPTQTYNQTQTATTPGASNYDWLFDYTSGCTSYGCNIADDSNLGYWTSTAVSSYDCCGWIVSREGRVSYDNAINIVNNGVRPVITVLKSSIS